MMIASFPTAVGIVAAAVAVWLTVRILNGRRPSRRAVIYAVSGVIAFAAFWALLIHRSHRQQMEAIALIEHAGGSVSGDYKAPEWLLRLQADDKLHWGQSAPFGPDWFRQWLHADFFVEYFLEVEAVHADEGPGSHIVTNISGQYRDISPIRVTDSDLAIISNLPRVERLYLRHMPITDEGLKHLRRMPHLRHLYLSYTQISDASADVLAGLTKLEMLRLAGTHITDHGVVKLQGLRRLEELNVADTAVTELGLKPFHGRPGLMLIWDDPNDLFRARFSY